MTVAVVVVVLIVVTVLVDTGVTTTVAAVDDSAIKFESSFHLALPAVAIGVSLSSSFLSSFSKSLPNILLDS